MSYCIEAGYVEHREYCPASQFKRIDVPDEFRSPYNSFGYEWERVGG